MSVVIVGCGYLGRRVGRLLNQQGVDVSGTTRATDRAEELSTWGVRPVIADVLEPKSLERFPMADSVFYCVGYDRASGVPLRTVYVEGLRLFLERTRGRFGRIVYASSTGVYGQEDGRWVDEDSPTEPRHESGRACLEAERLIGPEATILRFAGLYGPGRIVRRAAIERGEPIAGDPDRFLNLIHVEDAARAAVAALEQGRAGRTYLISDDRPVTRREYYGQVAQCLNAPAPRFEPPSRGSPEGRRDESNKRVSNARMKVELGVLLAHPDIGTGVAHALGAER